MTRRSSSSPSYPSEVSFPRTKTLILFFLLMAIRQSEEYALAHGVEHGPIGADDANGQCPNDSFGNSLTKSEQNKDGQNIGEQQKKDVMNKEGAARNAGNPKAAQQPNNDLNRYRNYHHNEAMEVLKSRKRFMEKPKWLSDEEKNLETRVSSLHAALEMESSNLGIITARHDGNARERDSLKRQLDVLKKEGEQTKSKYEKVPIENKKILMKVALGSKELTQLEMDYESLKREVKGFEDRKDSLVENIANLERKSEELSIELSESNSRIEKLTKEKELLGVDELRLKSVLQVEEVMAGFNPRLGYDELYRKAKQDEKLILSNGGEVFDNGGTRRVYTVGASGIGYGMEFKMNSGEEVLGYVGQMSVRSNTGVTVSGYGIKFEDNKDSIVGKFFTSKGNPSNIVPEWKIDIFSPKGTKKYSGMAISENYSGMWYSENGMPEWKGERRNALPWNGIGVIYGSIDTTNKVKFVTKWVNGVPSKEKLPYDSSLFDDDATNNTTNDNAKSSSSLFWTVPSGLAVVLATIGARFFYRKKKEGLPQLIEKWFNKISLSFDGDKSQTEKETMVNYFLNGESNNDDPDEKFNKALKGRLFTCLPPLPSNLIPTSKEKIQKLRNFAIEEFLRKKAAEVNSLREKLKGWKHELDAQKRQEDKRTQQEEDRRKIYERNQLLLRRKEELAQQELENARKDQEALIEGSINEKVKVVMSLIFTRCHTKKSAVDEKDKVYKGHAKNWDGFCSAVRGNVDERVKLLLHKYQKNWAVENQHSEKDESLNQVGSSSQKVAESMDLQQPPIDECLDFIEGINAGELCDSVKTERLNNHANSVEYDSNPDSHNSLASHIYEMNPAVSQNASHVDPTTRTENVLPAVPSNTQSAPKLQLTEPRSLKREEPLSSQASYHPATAAVGYSIAHPHVSPPTPDQVVNQAAELRANMQGELFLIEEDMEKKKNDPNSDYCFEFMTVFGQLHSVLGVYGIRSLEKIRIPPLDHKIRCDDVGKLLVIAERVSNTLLVNLSNNNIPLTQEWLSEELRNAIGFDNDQNRSAVKLKTRGSSASALAGYKPAIPMEREVAPLPQEEINRIEINRIDDLQSGLRNNLQRRSEEVRNDIGHIFDRMKTIFRIYAGIPKSGGCHVVRYLKSAEFMRAITKVVIGSESNEKPDEETERALEKLMSICDEVTKCPPDHLALKQIVVRGSDKDRMDKDLENTADTIQAMIMSALYNLGSRERIIGFRDPRLVTFIIGQLTLDSKGAAPFEVDPELLGRAKTFRNITVHDPRGVLDGNLDSVGKIVVDGLIACANKPSPTSMAASPEASKASSTAVHRRK